MAHVSTPLTWSLDSTASTTISVLKDVMRAATSDNVQPLALISCEKFGATLAMCPETNKKMEDLIVKVSGPKHLRFIKAQIGYSTNDAATQLSRSLAGVQFLGLTSALVSSMGTFEGANTLSIMLIDSASDKTLLPTPRQLKDLLGVMEHRFLRSGFADIWVGYQILLSSGLKPSAHNDYNEGPYELDDLTKLPASEGISQLVEAFRQLNRIGDATSITIRATSCAPWVMAFTRWCLGLPPSIVLPHGKTLPDQLGSPVTLFTVSSADGSGFDISIHRSIGSPADLLRSQTSRLNHSRMITVECFGRKMCHAMGGENSMAYKAMCEALPYAVKQSCELVQLLEPFVCFVGLPDSDVDETNDKKKEKADRRAEQQAARKRALEIAARHRTQPFPDDSISSVLTEVLKSQHYPQRLGDHGPILDLPLVHQHLHSLATSCACQVCTGISIPSLNPDRELWKCEKERFVSSIILYTADILAISLFEGPERLLVSDCRFRGFEPFNPFQSAISDIVKSGAQTACRPWDIYVYALSLVGHKKDNLENSVISSFKGQAVYPKVLETGDICQPGYLTLYWAPGLIYFDGEVYDRAIGPVDRELVTNPVITEIPRPVTEPLNLYPSMRMKWEVVRYDGFLVIVLTCGRSMGSAASILSNLTNALAISCPHDRALPLRRPDPKSRYIDLFSLAGNEASVSDPEGPVNLLAVDGDTNLRMFAMSTFLPLEVPVIIRDNACLQCCLDLCQETGSRLLIC